jgi:hypothetical protein
MKADFLEREMKNKLATDSGNVLSGRPFFGVKLAKDET